MGCLQWEQKYSKKARWNHLYVMWKDLPRGKTIALFGSYGWGDGQWMRDWADRMTAAGATVVNGEGVICQEAPDDAALDACKDLGKQLAAL